ncbi:single-stranded DNA-binding protein [Actinoplanes sp. SE50]|uniref:single-stranded DNA-binding protein n=1 Tax=unclassified Actinoplanes TaxID=2626549 RepID=UPI00023ED2C8|nr:MULTISPECIES: single-stranded DNA-binding protein [unclassified Actinoplanes]AEV86690.1 Single-stranded DNA-binding protein [Actinoplanes sp. SE50/110]ATO85088.1 single-stranded DNA-binding protein [Actinoplanes sp. SE50]SLM02499.1 single-stranded DNA-binding protein [Actinoplanes sp. SE50/110]
MAGETVITVVGNIVADPELRYTQSGAAVCSFRIASTPRVFDKQTQDYRDGEPLYLSCSVWREPAEHVAESLQRGARVIVQGRLKQRSYEKDGEKRTVVELDVDEIGPSLRYATVKVQKAQRSGGDGGLRPQQAPRGGGDPWATQGARSAASSGGQRSFDDEPPF